MSYLGRPTPRILGVNDGNPLIGQMDVHDAATIASNSHLLNKIRSCITRVLFQYFPPHLHPTNRGKQQLN